ncbi:MAG: hypothetical protein PHW04_13495 [Candidatus Wallbacteria bacterium]|nr:hypothetical protein [Candidatus Wallbacteria bacterium]
MTLSGIGKIIIQEWMSLPKRFPEILLDESIIMPNHFHGIIIIGTSMNSTIEIPVTIESSPGERATASVAPTRDDHVMNAVGAPFTGARTAIESLKDPTISLGKIVGVFKSLCARKCLADFKTKHPGKEMGKIWQRNYYEQIIREEDEMTRIRKYIADNPAQWETDTENPSSSKYKLLKR